jgi:phosphoenolpyruvate synthase/pyruvate phosphate dikinase
MSKIKRVYSFGGKTAEGDGSMRNLLGGKGANLAEMCLLGIPVPAGFTITTGCCTEYYDLGCSYLPRLPDWFLLLPGLHVCLVCAIQRHLLP